MSLFGKGSIFNPGGFIGKAGDLKAYAGSKDGSMLSGRWLQEGGAKKRDMESARTFDVFGSPATAGTGAQPYARLGAILYGGAMGLGAAGAGGSGGTGASVGGSSGSAAAGTSTGSGAATTGTAGSSPGWAQWLRMAPKGGQQQQQFQPNMQMIEDDSTQQLLAQLLRSY